MSDRVERFHGIDAVGHGDLLAGDVARDARLDRRAAVAEHVHAKPTRGEMSFQFCTLPTQSRPRVLPSAHLPYVTPLASSEREAIGQHLALARLADELVVPQAQVQA